jgi:uncharacterized membrane protein YphA (DoxX/SURF4 family)
MPKRSDSGEGGGGGRRPLALNLRLVIFSLAFLRVFLGVKFLLAAATKWNWLGTPRLENMLTGWAKNAMWEPYGLFLSQSILPHASLFTYLVFFGELTVGLLLTLGLFSRAAALVGMFLNANFLLATWHLGGASQGVNQAFLAMEFATLLTGAGRVYGLDARLARKRPGWILW